MRDFDLRFYISQVWRRLPLFLLVVIAFTALGILAAYKMPQFYTSRAIVLVDRPRIPSELAATTVNVNTDEVIQIIRQRLLTSEKLLDIAQRLGVFTDDPTLADQEKVLRMRMDTTVAPLAVGRGADGRQQALTFEVSFTDENPVLAQRVAAELTTLVLEQNREFRREFATETTDFFRGEVDRLSAALAEIEGRIVTFKNENAAFLPESIDFRREETSRIQTRLIQLNAEEVTLREQRTLIQRAIENADTFVLLPGQQLSDQERDLLQLRRQLAQKSALLSESHPEIVSLKAEITVLEDIVRGIDLPGSDVDGAPQSQLDLNLRQIDNNLALVSQQRDTLERQLADFEASIMQTPDVEMSLNVLNRQHDALQTQYDAALEALNIAVQGQSIETEEQSDRFELIDPPVVPIRAEGPSRKVVAAAGVAGGIMAGFGLIVLLEILNATVRRPAELVRGLGIQPFATIPYIKTRREVVQWRVTVATSAIFVMIGLPVITYIVHSQVMPLPVLIGGFMTQFGLGQ